MAIINGFFAAQAVAAEKKADAQSHRIAAVLQVWKNSRKVFTSKEGTQFVTFRARLVEFDAEKGKELGLAQGENVRVRFFAETPISSTGGADPFETKQFYLASWLQVDGEKFQGQAYETTDTETGEIISRTPDPVTQARLRGGAFGATVEEALANMDQLAAELKEARKAKISEKEEEKVPF